MKISMICGLAALFNWAGMVALLIGIAVGDTSDLAGASFFALSLLAVSLTIIADLVGKEA
jgi:hypothetical protein